MHTFIPSKQNFLDPPLEGLWKTFGRYVNIPDSELDRLQRQCTSARECKQVLIQGRRRRSGRSGVRRTTSHSAAASPYHFLFKFPGKRHTYKRLSRVHSYLACVLCEHMLVWQPRNPGLFPSVIARAECNCACVGQLTPRARTSGK